MPSQFKQKLLKNSKIITANLHSKDDLARTEAAEACTSLAKHISDSDAMKSLLKYTFDIFHGSDGKITVVEHKMGILQV